MEETPHRIRLAARSRGFKRAGIILLLTGIGIALAIYFFLPPENDDSTNPALAAYNKSVRFNTENNFGSSALALRDSMSFFREPGHLALSVAVVSTLACLGCFYLAGIVEEDLRRSAP